MNHYTLPTVLAGAAVLVSVLSGCSHRVILNPTTFPTTARVPGEPILAYTRGGEEIRLDDRDVDVSPGRVAGHSRVRVSHPVDLHLDLDGVVRAATADGRSFAFRLDEGRAFSLELPDDWSTAFLVLGLVLGAAAIGGLIAAGGAGASHSIGLGWP